MPINQDELNAKLKYYYPGYIVNKKIVNVQDIRQVPKFVSEHLLTKVAEEGEEKIGEKLGKMRALNNYLQMCFVHHGVNSSYS